VEITGIEIAEVDLTGAVGCVASIIRSYVDIEAGCLDAG
jgi:hypothetical protein